MTMTLSMTSPSAHGLDLGRGDDACVCVLTVGRGFLPHAGTCAAPTIPDGRGKCGVAGAAQSRTPFHAQEAEAEAAMTDALVGALASAAAAQSSMGAASMPTLSMQSRDRIPGDRRPAPRPLSHSLWSPPTTDPPLDTATNPQGAYPYPQRQTAPQDFDMTANYRFPIALPLPYAAAGGSAPPAVAEEAHTPSTAASPPLQPTTLPPQLWATRTLTALDRAPLTTFTTGHSGETLAVRDPTGHAHTQGAEPSRPPSTCANRSQRRRQVQLMQVRPPVAYA